ncbi:GNAT family N-acetyltransferase [Legionella pneumophila serogroup 1]|uniref:GNAT family N-acetyltransferase n=1 Tax=Legionella pneumophila TaxID=446 RepID=A0AAN5PPR1_LEGPN|nr:GNAT family N-acetyltransferase [Legionella pneumophila]AMV14854.1 anhydro-N-acetylmuramic acid kinase [Legionella pneumophila]ANN93040.1 GNAT family acetyltransferase [Legionella pneumophila]MCH9061549.1 GNAT family N-acetyltransferase [Legionella pneumophila serogroup 1]MCH9064339.1 GNAT family N-acetyltransferase [Legionella pneumophila serogroup 1]MCH9066751.1 GNAT family N-acetyltransferase [Legionella pneumophila serogroup 1]
MNIVRSNIKEIELINPKIILKTERLILRTWKETDLPTMTAINQDPLVCRFLPSIGTLESTKKNIETWMKHYQEKGYTLYAVDLKSTQEMIGFIGLMTPSFEAHFTPAVEIGWRLGSSHWNKGYATEGAKAVLDYAFANLKLPALVSFTTKNNLASRRVMEKIGMHYDSRDDFSHPKLEESSPLKPHVLYRIEPRNRGN